MLWVPESRQGDNADWAKKRMIIVFGGVVGVLFKNDNFKLGLVFSKINGGP
jgi:hypothetical protein